jgi:hypothetical protein
MNRANHLPVLCSISLLAILLSSCHHHHPMTEAESTVIKDNVRQLTTAIARDISTKGPAAWLDHFDNAPGFFMASDGSLDFPDYGAAKRFILDTLVKNIPKIKLNWTAVRIYPLSRRLAAIGADFHEVLTTADGKDMPVEGYFSGTAALTGQGWKLLNLHWSTRAQTR